MALTEIIVDSQAYEVICKTETEVQKFSLYAVPSDVAYKELQRFSQFIYDNYANKLLGTPITIDGVPYDSIQTVLTALAANSTNDVAEGSIKWLTSGGAYKDKTSSATEGSKKVITAHGAYQDKTNSVQEGSTKNLTALGAYFHKYFNVPYNASDTDTRVMTAKGMFADKKSTAIADSMKNFTSGGAWDYFAGSKTFEIWLGKVFGTQLTNSWGRVSTIRTNDFAGRAEGNGTVVVAATASGMHYSTNGRSFVATDSGTVNFTCCHYANGIFVAGSDTNGLYWSEDGRAWHQATGIFDNPENSIYEVQYTPEVYTVEYLGGKWLAGCHGASGSNSRYALLISDDGKTWSSGAIQEDRTVKTMAYGEYTINGTAYKYWFIGGDYILRYSSDLLTWIGNFTNLATSKIIFVPRFKKFIITTPEPTSSGTFSKHGIHYFDTEMHNVDSIPDALGVNDVHYGYTRCVAATKEGIYWSTDGVNWTQSENAATGEYNKVFYANGMWLAGTAGSTYIRNSADNGINWHEIYGMTLEPTVIKHFNGSWLLGAANGAWHSDFIDLGYVYA